MSTHSGSYTVVPTHLKGVQLKKATVKISLPLSQETWSFLDDVNSFLQKISMLFGTFASGEKTLDVGELPPGPELYKGQ